MRYGLHGLYLEAFLGSGGSATSGIAPAASRLGSALRICLQGTPTRLHRNPVTGLPTVLRPSIARSYKYGTVNPFPISYAFQPGLRDRLTLGRLPLPRKPWIYGEYVFHIFYRYSCQHNHFSAVHETFRFRFSPQRTLPYQLSETNPKLRQHA